MTESALSHAPQGRLRAGWRVLAFCLLLVPILGIGGYIAAAIGAGVAGRLAGHGQAVRADVFAVFVYGWSALGTLAATWTMLRFVERRGWDYVGLQRSAAAPRRLGFGLCAGTLAIAVPCLALIALGWLDLQRAPATAVSPAPEAALALLLLVPAALAEELLIRGYLLSAIADGIGRWWALVLTSVLFALLHFRNPGMTPAALSVVALAGIFLGAMRYATSSLYAAWAAHLAWNVVLGVGLHAVVSGTSVAAAGWRTVDSGPDWATGGAWGPEGGLAAALGLLATTSFLIIHRPRVAGTNDTTTA